MTSKDRYSVLIVTEDGSLMQSCRRLLTGSGWRVICEKNKTQGLRRVEAQRQNPFSVAISVPSLSDSNTDTFLKKLSSLSPITQRMILIPANQPETLIESINAGHIHACVCVPFTEREFLSRVNDCRLSFKAMLKTRKLRHHVSVQRRQLAVAAKKLKRKMEKGQQLILKQKIENARFKSRISDTGLNLESVVDHHEIPKEPGAFLHLFNMICGSAQGILEKSLPDLDKAWQFPALDNPGCTDTDQDEYGQIAEHLKWLSLNDAFSQTGVCIPSTEDFTNLSDAFDDYFVLTVSKDHMAARLTLKNAFRPGRVDAIGVLKYLECHNICAGLLGKGEIDAWLNRPASVGDRLTVAKGRPPVHAESAQINWQFQTNYSTPGRMKNDGTIDFRDRGETPFVEKDDLLAEMKPAVEGIAGYDVCSVKIPAMAPSDPVFEPGPGARLSEDGRKIFADIDGTPFIDTSGRIRVNELLVIQTDVDFTTGHIHFDGDIVVNGTIRPGFEVKGVNLTADAVEGAVIELSGDLRVTNGIVDTKIRTVGNIHARFINKCEIFGFGDFIVQNEIVDSRLLLGGCCLIPSGSIVTASISARRGIDVKNAGSGYSQPPSLRIGMDDHAEQLIKEADTDLRRSKTKLADLKGKMMMHDKQLSRVRKRIEELDAARKMQQAEIEQIRQQKAKYEDHHFSASKIDKAVQNLKRDIDTADARTMEFLEKLDHLGQARDALKSAILKQEENNRRLLAKKQHLAALKRQKIPAPDVVVRGTIFKGTKITGPNSQTVLKWDHSNCIIKEKKPESPGSSAFRMTVSDR